MTFEEEIKWVKDIFEGVQDYDYCPIKELLSYIGADYNV